MSLTKYAEFAVLSVESATGTTLRERPSANPFQKQAHRHEFTYDRRPGYIYVRSRAISSRTNDNFDEFPAEEIKKAYRTFVGKPVFVNHVNANHRRARGVIIDAALHEDTNPDGSQDTWAEVLMEVDALRFPRLAESVINGDIARTSMGTDVAFSECTACGNKAYTPAEYCAHIPKMKGMKIRKVLASGAREEVLIAERCYGLGFFENSLLVEAPADPTAFVLGVDGHGISAKAAAAIIDEQPVTSARTASLTKTADEDQCYKCGEDSVPMEPDSRTYTCPECGAQWDDHGEPREAGLKVVEAMMCSECNPDRGLPDQLCSSHANLRMAEHEWGDLGPLSPYAKQVQAAMDSPIAGLRRLNDVDLDSIKFPANGTGATVWIYDGPYDGRPQRGLLRPDGTFQFDVGVATGVPNKKIDSGSSRYLYRLAAGPKTSGRTHAYGETKAPAQVDTLRADRCPVCKDDEAFNGEKCSVCGHVEPPAQFGDPDLTKAKEMDLRQDQAEQAGAVDPSIDPNAAEDGSMSDAEGSDLECTKCGEVFSAEGEPAPDPEDPEPEAQAPQADPEHPDVPEDADREKARVDDDLGDLADKSDKDLGLEDEVGVDDEDPESDPEAEPEADAPEAAADDLSDLPVAPNMTCPVCGQGTLVPVEPTDSTEQPDVEGGAVDMTEQQTAGQPNPSKQARNRIIEALRSQQREIHVLKSALREVVTAAGVQSNPKFAALMKSADGDAPATTTEQAKKPAATDNVENVGAAPAPANAGVTPDAVTDVANSNVALPEANTLDNLQDVTAPVGGTDSVVDKTHNEGEITSKAPTNDVMDPPGSSGWKSSAKSEDEVERERFIASLRLARLQISAGLADGEDLTIAQAIFDGQQSLPEITTEASTLDRVAARRQATAPTQQHRHLVPQRATRQPSFQQTPAIQPTAAVGDRGDDEFMFGSGVEG